MIFVYKIVNSVNGKEYIGITRNVKLRWNSHVCSSKTKNTPLYAAMRKYGTYKFNMQVICICPDWDYACYVEIGLIKDSPSLYNLADGGNGGYVVPTEHKAKWIEKLRLARKDRRPALGIKHTEENKILFSGVSRKYWDTQDTYSAEEVTKYPFKEANKMFGISKTHYYRLKRGMGNDHA